MAKGLLIHVPLKFGTTPSPSSAQQAVTREIQSRWGAFMRSSDPNPSGTNLGDWPPSTSTTIQALQFGLGGGEAAEDACVPTFWGDAVLYDWQIYGV